MKKLLSLLCLLLLLLLSACGSENKEKTNSSDEIHPHVFTERGANAIHHFMVCECGEKDNVAAHDFTEDDFCKTCGFYIYDMGDDCYSFYIPDEHGNIVRQMDFDEHDKLIYDWSAEYEYYDDHNPKHITEYLNGVVQSERSFQRCENPENGDVYLSEEIYYSDDGTHEFLIYDEYCNILSITTIDAGEDVITKTIYTYELDADGNCTHETVHTDGILSLEIFYKPTADGYFYPYQYIYYNETGEIDSEFRFDEFGNEID